MCLFCAISFETVSIKSAQGYVYIMAKDTLLEICVSCSFPHINIKLHEKINALGRERPNRLWLPGVVNHLANYDRYIKLVPAELRLISMPSVYL